MIALTTPDTTNANNNDFLLTSELCHTATLGIEQSKRTVLLNCVSYLQTSNYTCGPAAAMTIMRYYHKFNSSDMTRTTEFKILSEMGGNTRGTTPSQVESWLNQHGFSVTTGDHVTTNLLIDQLNQHRPVIVAIHGHWLVAKGYNKASKYTYKHQDEIIFADSCCNVTVMPREEVDSLWATSMVGQNFCSAGLGYYLIPTPNVANSLN